MSRARMFQILLIKIIQQWFANMYLRPTVWATVCTTGMLYLARHECLIINYIFIWYTIYIMILYTVSFFK